MSTVLIYERLQQSQRQLAAKPHLECSLQDLMSHRDVIGGDADIAADNQFVSIGTAFFEAGKHLTCLTVDLRQTIREIAHIFKQSVLVNTDDNIFVCLK